MDLQQSTMIDKIFQFFRWLFLQLGFMEEEQNAQEPEQIFTTEDSRKIWLFSGSYSDLSKLDFSKLNLRFLKIDSAELDAFLDQVNHENFGDHNKKLFGEYRDKNDNKKHMYALVPMDLSKEWKDYWLVKTTLQVMFPSDIALVAEIDFQFFDSKYLTWMGYGEWQFRSSGERYGDNFLIYPEGAIDRINEFINVFIDRSERLKYLSTTVSSYTSSFSEVFSRMQYLSLCISLESIIDGTTELVYRIRRNVALICGEFTEDSRTIFANVNKIYSLRSKIVHGENYDHDAVEKYLPYLQALVSRTIIELFSLNLPDKAELNSKLTEIGFGDKAKLSSNYKLHYFNVRTLHLITEKLE